MASTRSPTPASREGTPELESPTAKIRALLATVDSSDDENTNTNTNSTSGNKKKNSASATLASHRSLFGNPEAASTSRGLSDDDDDDGEEEVVVARPRGRLAARMHAALNQGGDNANQVLERETKTAADEDDDATPTAPRRLQRKSATETAVEDEDTPARSTSPGLFVSPSKPSPSKSTHNDESGSDADLPDLKTNRFKALVERKRKERLEREAAQEAKRAERLAQQEKLASDLPDLGSDDGDAAAGITDDEGGRKLTQEARPTRKASKKAIEEMNRETQRMARSMQLAHEAKTRKKISKSSLFERFNFKPAGGAAAAPEPKTASSSRPATPPSDVEMKDTEEPEDTPPSSPPTGKQQQQKQQEQQEPAAPITIGDVGQPAADQDDDLPDMNIQLSSQPREDKGKGKAVEVSEPVAKPKKQVRVRLPQPSVNVTLVDSDDELQITTTSKDKLKALFDSIPSKKPNQVKSLQALKALAQVRSPGKEGRRRGEKPGMNVGQLHMSLHQKARQQAKIERQRRLDALKAQGVVVETAEERERQMQEVEDIVAKARAEAEQIRDAEREKSKNGKGEEKEHDPLAWDDSDDEEYQASDDGAGAELSAVELSGSEDEDVEVGEDPGDPMFDEEADEGESEKEASDHEMADEDEDEDEEQVAVAPKRRSRKNVTVISDDEAELSVEATPKPKSKTHASPQAPDTKTTTPGSVLRSAKKTFIPGLPVSGPAGLSLTQIFAGTMDDSQVSPSGPVPTQSMMPDFDALPNSNFSATPDEPEVSLPSQKGETQGETQGIQLNYSQSQMHGLDTLLRDDIPATQYSEVIEASQDGGFQEHTPIKDRFSDPPFSTVDTLVLDKDGQESPLIRRGRLRQRRAMTPVAEDIPPTASLPGAPATPSAFQAMKEAAREKKRRQAQADFDKKKSKAKEMVEEQADESEDEYAGLGGADGEDSDNESTASLKDMVDDAANNDGDERKLAAFYADRERANDEKAVEQLFKDITNGNLRRKRGADYDLSDSDDGGEALRRRKRQQFAKMQTALFKDERVKKMAENPGNQAFLRTIEDRGSDDEMDYLNVVEEPSQKESQSQENEQQQQQVVPDSQPARSGPSGAVQNRAPAHLRRTKGGNKPSNIGEVRETLSNLLEDREGSFIPATVAGSDSEGGEDEEDEGDAPSARSDKENQAPNARRTHTVVDRISLKRNPSAASNSSRLAFTANEAGGTFKVPALLRRATTNSFKSTGSSASSSAGPSSTPGVTTSAGGASGSGFGDEAKIKRAAGKRSGVHAFARENERKAKMMENERRRQEKKVQGAKGRAGMVGGLLGKGTFE